MDVFEALLGAGKEAKDLDALEMAARAVVIYIVTLAIVRLGKKRFMGRATAFDVIVGIVLGSIASRAITGNAPMLPSMAACAVIMGLHWTFSAFAVRWHPFGDLIKGRNTILVKHGRPDEAALRSAHMTRRDIEEALRQQGITDLASVAEMRLERDGNVSVVKAEERPQVVSVGVASGVQTIRIELK
jgi:uncharacterized membrane protein YcaP (DUF421 family)